MNCIREEDTMRKAKQKETTYNPTTMIAIKNRQKPWLHHERPQSQGAMRFPKITWIYCHKVGHTRSECRNRFVKWKQTYYRQKMQAHMAEYDEEDQDNEEIVEDAGYDDVLQDSFRIPKC